MKKIIYIPFLLLIGGMASAEYTITVPLMQSSGGLLPDGSLSITTHWQDSQTIFGEWLDQGHPYDCNNWNPLDSSITIGQSFTQTATDCKQDQSRIAQNQEIESISGILRNLGEPYTESRTITVSSTRDSVGTMESWIATDPTYTTWFNSGSIYGCENWSPSPSTVTIGQSFIQTAMDCEQDQVRAKQNREIETTTNQIRNIGSPINEYQTLTVSLTRSAIGTKAEKQCAYLFDMFGPGTNVSFGSDAPNLFYFSWGGVSLGTANSGTLIVNNYKYTIGNYVESFNMLTTAYMYQICRETI